jgi:hypothetical protein
MTALPALAIEATAPVLPAAADLEVSATFARRPLRSACRERQKVPRPCTTARRGACLGAGARGP